MFATNRASISTFSLFSLFSLITCSTVFCPNPANGQILADWFSGPGIWRDANMWDNGIVPDNSAPDFYHAAIDSNAGVLSVVRLISTDNFKVDRLQLDEIDELVLEGNSSLQIEHDAGRPMSGVIANSGTIFLSSDIGAGNSQLIIETDVSLLSGGTIQMSGNNAFIRDIFGSPFGHLTNEDNVIQGEGRLGDDRLQLTNAGMGVIHANTDGGILRVEPRDSMINQGVMQASNGGILELIGELPQVTIDNSGGTIQAFENTSVDLVTFISISGGVLQGIGTGKIRVPSSTVTIADATIDNVLVENSANLRLNGTINNGSLLINDTAAPGFSRVLIDGESTFTGNGTITMNGSGAKLGGLSTNIGHLTNTNNTIIGQGEIGAQMRLTNLADGAIIANVAGEILLINTRNGVDLINDGTLRASNGGTLRIHGFYDGIFDNTNGQIIAGDNSVVDFDFVNLLIVGGDLLAEGTGIFEADENTTVRLQDLNLAAPFQVGDNSSLSLIGTIHNSDIHINGQTAPSSNLVINSDTTLDGNSVINMNGPGARIWSQSGNGRLTNVNNTIRGQGKLGESQSRLTNQADGLIDADVSGETMIVSTISNEIVFNQGIMQASNGGILQINGQTFGGLECDNTGGTIQAFGDSLVRLQDGIILNGGLLASFGTGQIEVPSFESASLKNIVVEGNLNSAGNLVLRGPVVNNANLVLGPQAATLQVGADLPVVVSGLGSIELAHVDQRLLGQTGNQGFGMTGGVLSGVGQIQVNTQFSDDATVAPGNSIGTLFFNSNNVHKFVDGATIEIELQSTIGTPGVDWDFIDITGNSTLGFDDEFLPSAAVIKLVTLDSNGEPGPLAGFDPNEDFSIEIAAASSISGFDSANVSVDTSSFVNSAEGTFCASVEDSTIDTLRINYFALLLGDMNGDCAVNLLDVAPFVAAISNGTFIPQADINQDGAVNLLDVAPFVSLLSN